MYRQKKVSWPLANDKSFQLPANTCLYVGFDHWHISGCAGAHGPVHCWHLVYRQNKIILPTAEDAAMVGFPLLCSTSHLHVPGSAGMLNLVRYSLPGETS